MRNSNMEASSLLDNFHVLEGALHNTGIEKEIEISPSCELCKLH
ncbi:mCG1028954 [Mus musculus]|nr:mCG1028954 [Mus musculus]